MRLTIGSILSRVKSGVWYNLGDVTIEYEPITATEVLSVMDELEEAYDNPDDRWWKLRARMASQKYALENIK